MKLTMKDVEKQIDRTIGRAKKYTDDDIDIDELNAAIDNLRDVLCKAVKAGVHCNAKRIRQKFAKLDKILKPLMAKLKG